MSSDRVDKLDFQYDNVFDEDATQDDIFSYSKDLIDSVLHGYNATIFAFGMTGSGKTHTIAGSAHCPGIVPRCIHYIFENLTKRSEKSTDQDSCVSMVFLTYIELYNNNIYDLLSSDPTTTSSLRIHDHPVHGITVTGKIHVVCIYLQ